MQNFQERVAEAAERAVLHAISSGNWIQPDYNSRAKVPPSFIAECWALVDVEKVKRAMAKRFEDELADRIVNHLAAEIATDIKQILSVSERREAIRSIARKHMDEIMQAGAKS